MKYNYSYLTKSPKTGVYGYRRDIPKISRHLFGGISTLKKSFKTKSIFVAELKLNDMNVYYNSIIGASEFNNKAEILDNSKVIKSVIAKLIQEDMFPKNLPKLDYTSEDSEYDEAFKGIMTATLAKLKLDTGKIDVNEYTVQIDSIKKTNIWRLREFGAKRDLLKDQLHVKYRDVDASKDEIINPYINCHADDYVVPQLDWNERDPEVIKYRIMCGKPIMLLATWIMAVDDYVERYKEVSDNNERVIKYSKAVRSICEALSSTLPNRMNTELTSIDEIKVESFANARWPGASTRLRNLSVMRAVWSSWNKYNHQQRVDNDPFVLSINSVKVDIIQSKKNRFPIGK